MSGQDARSAARIEGSAETPKGDGLSYPGRGARGNEAEEPGGCQSGSSPRSTAATCEHGYGEGDCSWPSCPYAAPETPVPDPSAASPRHYHLKLDYGKPTERIVSFATQAERLAAARAILREERKSRV